MYDWIYALIGFIIMFGILAGIGINQPRGTSVKMWCYGYLAISIGFDALVILTLLNASQYVWLNNLLLGLSAGAATGLGIHVAHHISEEDEHDDKSKDKRASMFGF
jgi:ABC-type Co2+ transport system permease subunit